MIFTCSHIARRPLLGPPLPARTAQRSGLGKLLCHSRPARRRARRPPLLRTRSPLRQQQQNRYRESEDSPSRRTATTLTPPFVPRRSAAETTRGRVRLPSLGQTDPSARSGDG